MKHTPALTAEILETQGEHFDVLARLIREGRYEQAMQGLIFTQAVLAQELANIADNWAE